MVGFISFIIFILKATSMYFYLTYHYYHIKLTFFSTCTLKKAEIIDLKKLTIFVLQVDQVAYNGFQTFLVLTNYFKKQAKPTDLSLSSSTGIGLLQNLQAVKALTKVDKFS